MNPVYAQIYKVDEETRTIHGRATQEVIDRDGECMDYASSKPFFQSWSAEIFKDSGGLSHGNVRAMHGNTAAGKLTDIQFLDDERAIDVVARIVDDNEWSKVLEGVYGGFSIGGRYSKKWTDISNGKPVTKYTAVPSEISIVDRPACQTAKFFTVHKRDGSKVRKQFQSNALVVAMNSFQRALGTAGLSRSTDVDAIRKIHARGSRPLERDFLRKYSPTGTTSDRTIREIRRAHGLGKSLTLPRESVNGEWDNVTANTGATNNFRDSAAPTIKPTIVPRQDVRDVSRSPNIQAVLDALKQDFARGAKRLG